MTNKVLQSAPRHKWQRSACYWAHVLVKKCVFTFAPGRERLFFRLRDNSILPPRLPTCTGSKGVEEYMGSVNWGWGSHIILGFQLGESFGSVSCKTRYSIKHWIYFYNIYTHMHYISLQISKTCQTNRGSGWRFTPSTQQLWELIPKHGDAFHLQVFMCKCGWLMHINIWTLLVCFITVNNPETIKECSLALTLVNPLKKVTDHVNRRS